MPSDLDELSKFGRSGDIRAKPLDNPRKYEAFRIEPRTQTLRISRANGVDDYQSYAYFLKCKGARVAQTTFRLYYSFENIRITGRNLGPVMAAIGAKRCNEITEFDRNTHDEPEADVPIITKIEFINKPLADAIAEEEQTIGRR